MEDTVLVIIFVIALLALAVVGVYTRVDTKRKKAIVLQNSHRLQELFKLNQKTKFRQIDENIIKRYQCNSKRAFDRFNYDDFLISLIDADENSFIHIVWSAEYNRKTYESYFNQVQAINTTITQSECEVLKISIKAFLKYESKLFEENMYSAPVTDPVVRCIAYYTSPQGKKHYEDCRCYFVDALRQFIKQAKTEREKRSSYQQQIKDERAKLTPGLRYDVLKRDNYRCQICGATQSDGVKLHVDHIFPVSRGGKTELDNLRTLCDRCNLGKSAKV